MSITSIDKEYVAGTYGRFPVEIVSGKGSILKDSAGKEYVGYAYAYVWRKPDCLSLQCRPGAHLYAQTPALRRGRGALRDRHLRHDLILKIDLQSVKARVVA